MPVYLDMRTEDGWKKLERDRVGPCLVINFRTTKDDKKMFSYAPNLRDRPFWDKMWKLLDDLDVLNKEDAALQDELRSIEKRRQELLINIDNFTQSFHGFNNKDSVVNGMNCEVKE